MRLDERRTSLRPLGADDHGHTPSRPDLIQCLDLRARYRREEVAMRRELLSLQAQMEASARAIWHHLASGQAVPQELRTTCDELVVAVEDAERELADARAAIEGAGDEIAAHLARRLHRRLQSADPAVARRAAAPTVDAGPWMR